MFQKEAADVENDNNISKEDVYAIQKFVLKLRVTETDTIINKYPEEKVLPKYELPSDVSFEDITTVYDGNEHIIEVAGLPEGIKVSYTNNKGTNVGTYNAVATFELSEELSKMYSAVSPETKTATLQINKAIYQLPSNVSFENMQLDYDKQEHEIIANNVPEGINVKYTDNKGTNAGTYNAVATFELSDALKQNYETIEPLKKEAILTINKILYVLPQEVKFENKTIVYDGAEHSIQVEGLPNEVTATYTSNKAIEKGTYNAVATFNLNDDIKDNYSAIVPATMEAKLKIIEQARVAGITTDNKNVFTGNMSIDLYTYNPNNNMVKEESKHGGLIYTIVPIGLIKEDGSTAKILYGDVNTYISEDSIGKTLVLENADQEMSYDIEVIGYIADGNGGYKSTTVGTEHIDAIGIAITDITDDYGIELLNQGLTIKYDGIDENDNVCRKTTLVNVSVKSQQVQARANKLEPQQLNVEKTNTSKVKEISIKMAPKAKYYAQELDYTGAKLTVIMEDGTTKEIDINKDMVTGYNKTSLEQQTIVVTYEGKTATFNMILEDNRVKADEEAKNTSSKEIVTAVPNINETEQKQTETTIEKSEMQQQENLSK